MQKNDPVITESAPPPAASSEPSTAQKSEPVLTEDEKTMVGVWEAEDGDLIAIKARGGDYRSFNLDAILYSKANDDWFKITRDETTLTNDAGEIVLSDEYLCPSPNDPEGPPSIITEERLEYDAATDTLLYTATHPTIEGGMVELTNTFKRTDRAPDDAGIEWDWYYEIHGDRK